MVHANNRPIGRNDDNIKPINLQKFFSRGKSGTGHTRELFVKSKIILKGDRARRARFFFYFHAFFSLNRLVNTFAPAPTRLKATSKGVHDDNLALLNDIILVTLKKSLRFYG